MIQENAAYGEALITRYLPTATAQRYLNCCTVAGRHRCNGRYYMRYDQGFPQVFVLFTVGGKGWIRIDRQQFALKEGSLAIVPADLPMEYGTDTVERHPSWEFYWLNLEGESVRRTAVQLWEDDLMAHTGLQVNRYEPLFCALMDEQTPLHRRERYHSKQIQTIFDRLLDDRLFHKTPADDQRVEDIIHYLQMHCTQDIPLSQLSQHFYLSPNHIIRVVREVTGYTPHEYLLRYRLTKACELLQGSTMPIQEIGWHLGFRNNSHFAAQFRKVYGMAPREYRRVFSVTLPLMSENDM